VETKGVWRISQYPRMGTTGVCKLSKCPDGGDKGVWRISQYLRMGTAGFCRLSQYPDGGDKGSL